MCNPDDSGIQQLPGAHSQGAHYSGEASQKKGVGEKDLVRGGVRSRVQDRVRLHSSAHYLLQTKLSSVLFDVSRLALNINA